MELLSGRDRHRQSSNRTREHITRSTGESCEEGARCSLPRRWQSGDWIVGMASLSSLSLRSLQSETRKRPEDGRGRRNCPKCPFNSVGRRSEGDLNAAENEHLPIDDDKQGQRQRDETASFVRPSIGASDAENSGGRPADLNGARELAPLPYMPRCNSDSSLKFLQDCSRHCRC